MAFATVEDVATRLVRTLSAEEGAAAEMLIEAATAVIADAAGKDDAWAAGLDPVPQMLRFLTIELVCRAMANPDALRSISKQLGSYQSTRSFRDVGGSLLLSDVERLLVRRTVFGRTSGTVKIASVVDEMYEIFYGCGS